jgi:uncharacterized protein (DUF1697 family)
MYWLGLKNIKVSNMQTYIALLRGINVSGQKKIKMADLKVSLEKLHFNDIVTYIQSGNIIFKSDIKSINQLEQLIHDIILKDFGFEVPILIKTPQEITDAFENNPFEKDTSKDPKKFYLIFLKDSPLAENITILKTYDYSPEEYVLDDKIIYFYAANGAGNAKMNNNFFEKKLKVQATTRNWNTTHKLVELSQ